MKSCAIPLLLVGASWIIGGQVPRRDGAILVVGSVTFAIGFVLWMQSMSVRQFSSASRRAERAATVVSLFIGLVTTLLSIAAVIAGALVLGSSIDLVTDPFWRSPDVYRDSLTVGLTAVMGIPLMILVSLATLPLVSTTRTRMRRVRWIQRCWLVAHNALIVCLSIVAYAILSRDAARWPASFDSTTAILTIAIIASGAAFAWHYRNRQLTMSERSQLLVLVPEATAALAQRRADAPARIAALQAVLHADPLVPRSLATPPVASDEIVMIIDALHAAATNGTLPPGLATKTVEASPDLKPVRDAVESFHRDPAAFLSSGVAFLEQFRLCLLDGRTPPQPNADVDADAEPEEIRPTLARCRTADPASSSDRCGASSPPR